MAANRGARLKEWFWKSTQNVVNANQVPVISDNTWHDGWPLHTDAPVAMPFDFGWGDKGTSGEMNQCCIDRHNGFVNFAFADWSARRWGSRSCGRSNGTGPLTSMALDERGRRHGRRLAAMAAEIQGLLREKQPQQSGLCRCATQPQRRLPGKIPKKRSLIIYNSGRRAGRELSQ